MTKIARLALILAVLVGLRGTLVQAQYSYQKFVTLTFTLTSTTTFLSSDVTAGSGHPQAAIVICRLTTSSGEIGYRTDSTAPTNGGTDSLQVEPGEPFVITTPKDIQNFIGIGLTATTTRALCQIYG